jgi:hypothetical protein
MNCIEEGGNRKVQGGIQTRTRRLQDREESQVWECCAEPGYCARKVPHSDHPNCSRAAEIKRQSLCAPVCGRFVELSGKHIEHCLWGWNFAVRGSSRVGRDVIIAPRLVFLWRVFC